MTMLDGDIRLNGAEIGMIVGDALVSFDEELAFDRSPIIRIGLIDPDRTLISSGLLDLRRDDADRLDREVELVVDRVAYWLRHVAKQGDQFMLTFEDRTAARLRDRHGAMKTRGLDDRAFIARLCTLAGVPEPITAPTGPRESRARRDARLGTEIRVRRDRDERDRRRAPGLPDTPNLTVKGTRMTRAQAQIAGRLLTVALEMGAGPRATLALILAAIVESVLGNPASPSADGYGSYGVLQARVGVSRGARGTVNTIDEARDVEYMAESFLIDKAGHGFTSRGGAMYLERTRPSMTPGEIAQAVEGSAYPDRYAMYEAEGRAIVEKFTGGVLPAAGRIVEITRTTESPLMVERGETYWDAAVRTAEQRNARWFVVHGQPYYLYDEALMAARPIATLGEATPGVEWIDWEWAPHKQLRRTDVSMHVAAPRCLPGSVALLDETCGPGEGRWLVGEYERSRLDSYARVTLQKGRRPRLPTEVDRDTVKVGGGAQIVPGVSGTGGNLTGIQLDGPYAGTQAIFEQFIHPLMARHALTPGSTKRATKYTASGNISDHWEGLTTSYATDYPTTNGAAAARALAQAVGWDNYQSGRGHYGRHTFTVNGRRFIMQILWQSDPDHDDHVHVGVKVA